MTGSKRSEGFWIIVRDAGTAQLGIYNYLHFCSGTWALLAMEGSLNWNWSPRKLEWGLLPGVPWHIMGPASPPSS